MRLRDLAAARMRYGYRRLHVLLRREGWSVNHKRAYRLYAEEGLSIRTKLPRRKRAWRYRQGPSGKGWIASASPASAASLSVLGATCRSRAALLRLSQGSIPFSAGLCTRWIVA